METTIREVNEKLAVLRGLLTAVKADPMMPIVRELIDIVQTLNERSRYGRERRYP